MNLFLHWFNLCKKGRSANRYIYHYLAVDGRGDSLSGIARLSFRIITQGDLERLMNLLSSDDFKTIAVTSLSYLGREHDDV